VRIAPQPLREFSHRFGKEWPLEFAGMLELTMPKAEVVKKVKMEVNPL
jgi:hypothetical protein